MNTPSRLRRSEAADAAVRAKPVINSSGARAPPNTIAPASHGRSLRVSGRSVATSDDCRRRSQTMPRPIPEPR